MQTQQKKELDKQHTLSSARRNVSHWSDTHEIVKKNKSSRSNVRFVWNCRRKENEKETFCK